jgi:hypothetical protein
MKFAPWVHARVKGKAPSDATVATNRLRYILMRAALHKTEGATIRSLAQHIGIEYNQLYRALRKGAFTVKLAASIEEAVGRDLIRKEHLVFPLNIEVDTE